MVASRREPPPSTGVTLYSTGGLPITWFIRAVSETNGQSASGVTQKLSLASNRSVSILAPPAAPRRSRAQRFTNLAPPLNWTHLGRRAALRNGASDERGSRGRPDGRGTG